MRDAFIITVVQLLSDEYSVPVDSIGWVAAGQEPELYWVSWAHGENQPNCSSGPIRGEHLRELYQLHVPYTTSASLAS